jgi:NADH-quinone oxidoreductase subunit K
MTLVKFLTIPTILYILGLSGIFLNRKNIIVMLMSIELMLLAINLNFIVFSCYLGDRLGSIFALFVLTVAAAESSIGLAILVVFYRVQGTIAVNNIRLMKG